MLQQRGLTCCKRPCQHTAMAARGVPMASRRRVVSSVVAAPEPGTNVSWDTSPGGYETAWYAWPEGYLGQSFNLAGKLELRATGLQDDLGVLADYSYTRREESEFSEHTITSAADSASMVSAVVGASVDMGLFKAGGSASFEMYQNFKSNSVSHNLVASFQQNCMLERNQLSLSQDAKDVLREMGPDEFRARYGTHFVCGVGYRGAFIGSVNIRMTDKSQSMAGSLHFEAEYSGCSATADIKASMKKANIDTEITVEWSKWGVDDDESMDSLEEACAADDVEFAAIRQLAMQTADKAVGYPKLIKLRPYSTLPDYVEACEGQGAPQLIAQDEAMAFLTNRYRRAAYILSTLEQENRPGMGHNNPSLVERTARKLVAEMEKAFGSQDALASIQAFIEYDDAMWHMGEMPAAASAGKALHTRFNEVLKLDFMLFKYLEKPIYEKYPTVLVPGENPLGHLMYDSQDGMVHIAAASSGSSTRPFGRWYLNYQEQETFTRPGLYVVTLSKSQGILHQVGDTKRFDNTEADGNACWRYWNSFRSTLDTSSCVFVVFKVGDCMSQWPSEQKSLYASELNFLAMMGVQGNKVEGDFRSGSIWAAVYFRQVAACRSPSSGLLVRGVTFTTVDGKPARLTRWEPDNMVLVQAAVPCAQY